ncbi:MAG: hypothetical protein ACI4RA_05720 [Kiritimatiellia bacterium]
MMRGGCLRVVAAVWMACMAVGAMADIARVDGKAVVFSCPSAGEFRLDCQTGAPNIARDGASLAYSFTEAPGKARLSMLVPIRYISGGRWRVDEREGAFPFALGLSEKLFQGNGREITVTDLNGETLSLTFPVGTYFEVQDNRKWNWSTFECRIHLPAGMDKWTTTFRFSPATKKTRLLDRFGQTARDFPGKISSEDELRRDVATEGAFYGKLDFPGKLAAKGMKLDAYGGLAGTGRKLGLKKTGFFHLEKVGRGASERWVFVDPAGNAFFHLGVCEFGLGDDLTDVTGREDAFEWIPPHEGAYANAWKTDEAYWSTRAVSHYRANLVRKYGAFDANETARRNIARVRAIGFNSMGAFGEVKEAANAAKFPYVRVLPLWGVKTIPSIRGLFDPYDANVVREIEKRLKVLQADAADPLLIGYFLENEQAFEEIPRALPNLDDACSMKRAFKASGLDARAFTAEVLERYYSVIVRAVRANDPNHLILGNRWMPSTANDETLCRVAARHLDAISINYYAHAVDAGFAKRVYKWTGGKPQLWSEFFYSAGRESNVGPFTYDLPTQRERGQAYGRYLDAAVSLGFVVGVEWFTLVDQAATGRFFQGAGGESFNTGLLSVTDRPYADLWGEMLRANIRAAATIHKDLK